MKLFVTAQTTAAIGRSSNSTKKRKEFVIITQRKEHHVNAPSFNETHQPQSKNAPTSKKKHQLTKKQQDIINFCSIPRSAQEIMDRLGIRNQSRSRKRYIQSMIEDGQLEMTIPENPNDPNQKYRRVKK